MNNIPNIKPPAFTKPKQYSVAYLCWLPKLLEISCNRKQIKDRSEGIIAKSENFSLGLLCLFWEDIILEMVVY